MEAARRDDVADLGRVERDRDGRLHRRALDLARGGVDARGEVDGDDRHAGRVHLGDRARRVEPRLAAEARAEERVNHDVGGRLLVDEGHTGVPSPPEHDRRVARDLLLGADDPDDGALARARELCGDQETVAAVRARATADGDPLGVREAGEHLLGYGRSGALHQLQRRARVRRLGGAHLPGRVERLGPGHSGTTATQTAAAMPFECVMERSSEPVPRRRDQPST